MKKEKIDILLRIVHFVQLDFDMYTRPADRWELLVAARDLGLFEINQRPVSGVFSKNEINSAWKELLRDCQTISSLLRFLTALRERGGILRFDKPTILSCDPEKDDTFQQWFVPPEVDNEKYLVTPFFKDDSGEYEPILDELLKGHPEEGIEGFSLSQAGFWFLDLITGLPFNRLKQCPECSKYFIQKTAKKKIYCSVLCKNRHIVKQSEDRPKGR